MRSASNQDKRLKKQGNGSLPNRKRAPTNEEVDKMWYAINNDASPEILQLGVWWVVTTRFGNKSYYTVQKYEMGGRGSETK